MSTPSTAVQSRLSDREVREFLAEMTGFGIENFSITSARPNSWTVRASCGCRVSVDLSVESETPLVHVKGSTVPSKQFCVLSDSTTAVGTARVR